MLKKRRTSHNDMWPKHAYVWNDPYYDDIFIKRKKIFSTIVIRGLSKHSNIWKDPYHEYIKK